MPKLNKEQIPLFFPKFRTEECLLEIRDCLENGWTGSGFKTLEFESKWKTYTGEHFALFLNSATSALQLAVESAKRVFNWSEGDEVISTPLTFVSTNHVILQAGLVPIFADVDESLNLDPASILERLSKKTKAIMFVGIGGNPSNLLKISEICQQHGLILILDAAHMSGTRIGGKFASEYADVTCYSFQAVKNLPTGDSGMITTSDANIYKVAKSLSWLGIDKETYVRVNSEGYSWKYDVKDVGYKHNGNSIMAALGIISLKYLEQDNAWRRALAETYKRELSDTEGIEFVSEEENVTSSQHLFQIKINRRDEVIESLRMSGISTGVHYVTNTAYPMYQHMKKQTPNASRLSDRVLSLPLFIDLTNKEAIEIAGKLRNVLGKIPK